MMKNKKIHSSKSLFIRTSCALCGSTDQTDFELLFFANFAVRQIASLFSARRLPDGFHYQLVKCKKDGLVRSNPVLQQRILDRLYRKSVFTYQAEVKNLTKTYLNSLLPTLRKLPKTASILEIGCGSGFVLSGLKKMGYKNVYGVEPSTEAISFAEKSLQKNIEATFFSDNVFPKQKFDFIFLFQTLDHIADPNTFLADCRKKLKKGGYLLSYHHNVESFSAKFFGEKSPIFDIEHTYLYSQLTTKKLFEKHGFKICELYSPKNTVSLFHFFWLLPLPRKLKKWALQITKVKEILNQFNVQLELGNTCVVGKLSSWVVNSR